MLERKTATIFARAGRKRLSLASLLLVATGPFLWGGLSPSRAGEPNPQKPTAPQSAKTGDTADGTSLHDGSTDPAKGSLTFAGYFGPDVASGPVSQAGSERTDQKEPPKARLTAMQPKLPVLRKESATPFSLGMTYAVYSDYVFRGINLSEIAGEGRELPNHQVSIDVGVDLGLLFDGEAGSLGTLGFNTWLEWFAGQKTLNPAGGGQNLQEVDYTITWSTDLESIGSTLTLGYVFFTIPNAKAANTQE